jgi:hypothetical protein
MNRGEGMHIVFWWESQKEEVDMGGRIILTRILER